MAQFQSDDRLSLLLKTYTHGQVRFIEEYGLESRHVTIFDMIGALILTDGSLIKPGEHSCFLSAENDTTIQLWEYPAEIPFPPQGKWRKRFDGGRRLVAQWSVGQIRWLLSPNALQRYKVTAPDVPEWNDEVDG